MDLCRPVAEAPWQYAAAEGQLLTETELQINRDRATTRAPRSSTTSTTNANQPNRTSSAAPCPHTSPSTMKRTSSTHPTSPRPASSPTSLPTPHQHRPHKQNCPVIRRSSFYFLLVELRGFEPLTSSMPWKRATNCAIAPKVCSASGTSITIASQRLRAKSAGDYVTATSSSAPMGQCVAGRAHCRAR